MVKFHNSIKFQCIFLITITFVSISLLSILFAFHQNTKRLKESYIEKNISVMEVGRDFLYARCENIYQATLSAYSDDQLYKLLSASSVDYETYNQLKSLFTSYCSNTDIHQIYLWCPTLRCSFLAGQNALIMMHSDTLNPQLQIYQDNQIHIMPVHLSTYYDYEEIGKIYNDLLPTTTPVVSFTRSIYPIHEENGTLLANLTVDVTVDAFQNVFSLLYDESEEDFYLLDENNQIILSSQIENGLSPDQVQLAAAKGQQVTEAESGSLLFQEKISSGDFSLRIVKVAYLSNIFRTALQSFRVSLLSLLLSWFLVLVIVLIIFEKLIRRIEDLNSYTGDIKSKGIISSIKKYPTLLRNDELGILARTFEQAIFSIHHLTEQKYELIISNKETQIKMLQAQINPHFINNALQAIGNATFEHEPIYVYNLIAKLGKMMKYSMRTEQNLVEVKDELDYLANFLIFQQERLGSKFQYHIDSDEESQRCQIPKMLIQPLVENCVIHGYTGAKETFELNIQTFAKNSQLYIYVRDNGIGVTPLQLEKLRNPAEYQDSIGIRNIYKRLSLYYPQNFSFTFRNLNPHGLESRICIPTQIPVNDRKNTFLS